MSPLGRRRHRWAVGAVLLALVLAVVATELVLPLDRPGRGSPGPLLGVYSGPAGAQDVDEFGRRLSVDVDVAADFAAGDDWEAISMSTGFPVDSWKGSGYRMAYGIPLLPRVLDGDEISARRNGDALARGARGAFDEHFSALARRLVRADQSDAILRLGWEFNTDFFPWGVAAAEPDHSPERKSASFAAFWRRVVLAMRAVPGADFAFDWNPLVQDESRAPDPALAWPGDDVVDVIGLDVYDNVPVSAAAWDADQRWQALLDGRGLPPPAPAGYGLRWQAEFAAAHGKPLSFPEWGVTLRPDGSSSGGGDNPDFVRRLGEWIERNDVLYHVYFNADGGAGQHCLTCRENRFPDAARAFRTQFSSGS